MSAGSRGKRHTAGGKGGRFRRPEPAGWAPSLFGRFALKTSQSPLETSPSHALADSAVSSENMMRPAVPRNDRALIQIVDAALADAARRSGAWLVCRPGCTQCCMGAFPINQLDAARLRKGLADLEARAPVQAEQVRSRARDAVARPSPDFPGDPVTGLLHQGIEAAENFPDFANDEPCPALDPATGHCELYQMRP